MVQEKADLLRKIDSSLNTLRPYLQADGGDVEVVDFTDEGVVKIKLKGSCESCSMSSMTMKAGIEKTIRRDFPNVIRVEAVESIP